MHMIIVRSEGRAWVLSWLPASGTSGEIVPGGSIDLKNRYRLITSRLLATTNLAYSVCIDHLTIGATHVVQDVLIVRCRTVFHTVCDEIAGHFPSG